MLPFLFSRPVTQLPGCCSAVVTSYIMYVLQVFDMYVSFSTYHKDMRSCFCSKRALCYDIACVFCSGCSGCTKPCGDEVPERDGASVGAE